MADLPLLTMSAPFLVLGRLEIYAEIHLSSFSLLSPVFGITIKV